MVLLVQDNREHLVLSVPLVLSATDAAPFISWDFYIQHKSLELNILDIIL